MADPNDPIASQFTWENQDADPAATSGAGIVAPTPDAGPYNAGRWGQFVNDPNNPGAPPPVTAPGVVPSNGNATPTPGGDPTAPMRTGSSAGVSGSHSGMTDAGLKKSNDLFSGVDAETDAQMAGEKGDVQGDAARYGTVYGEKKHALDELGTAETEHYDRIGALIDRQNDFQQTAINLEQRAAQQSQVESQQYVSSIKEQLAGVRSLIQQSGDPRSRLSGTQVFGLGLAAAAQGFLAVRGIKIDVTGQIDKWVEQGMQEHQNQVQNSQAALGDTFHLYEVARQTSQDQYEARQRYRAMVIEGFKGQVQAEASRFGGQVAQAHADEATASLDMEQAQTIDGLQERFRKQRFEQRKAVVDEVKAKGQLAIEKEANSIKWAEVGLKRKELDAKKPKEEKLPTYISDPTQTKLDPKTGKPMSGGKVVAIANPDSAGGAKAAEELATAFNQKATIDQGIARMKELKPDGATWSEFVRDKTSDGYRRFKVAQSELLADLLQAKSGKVVTDSEYERYKAMVQEDKAWQAGDNEGLLDEMVASGRRNLNSQFEAQKAAGNIRGLAAGEKVDARYGADEEGYLPNTGKLDPAGSQLDHAQLHGEKPVPTAISEQEQGVTASSNDRDSGSASRAFGAFSEYEPRSGAIYTSDGKHPGLHEPDWAHRLDMIATGAVRPDILKQFHESVGAVHGGPSTVEESPAKIAADAMESLRGISHGEHDEPDYMQGYAKHLRALIKKDPEKAMAELTGEL